MIIFSVSYRVYRERKGELFGDNRNITIEATNGLDAARIALEQIGIATSENQTITNISISVAIDHDTTRMRRARRNRTRTGAA